VANVVATVRVIAATVIVAVSIVVVVPSIAATRAQAPRPQPIPIIAAHRAMRVLVAPLVLSRVMTLHVKAVAIRADVVATAATKVTADKTVLTARKQSTALQVFKQAVQRKHHVSRKAHALKRLALHKPMINVTCKTAQKVNWVLTMTTAVIQSANAAVVVAVVANVVKTKVQALRTKMVHQACNSPRLTLSQTVV